MNKLTTRLWAQSQKNESIKEEELIGKDGALGSRLLSLTLGHHMLARVPNTLSLINPVSGGFFQAKSQRLREVR